MTTMTRPTITAEQAREVIGALGLARTAAVLACMYYRHDHKRRDEELQTLKKALEKAAHALGFELTKIGEKE